MNLPTFVIIGAMKCGTSSLYGYLGKHPQVSMSTLKEPNFFVAERNFGRGIDWYRSLWPRSTTARGEASSSYTKCHVFGGIPGRMHEILPEAKLIYLVRDPFARIESHYVHNVAAGREDRVFADAVRGARGKKHYLLTSAYATQLEAFLEFYPQEQILVVDAHDLLTRRLDTLRSVFRHVGVSDRVKNPLFYRKNNRSRAKRGPGSRPIERPMWPEDLRDEIAEIVAPEARRLRAITGLELPSWSV